MQAFQDTLVIVLDTVVIVSLYPFTLPDPYHVPLEESCNLCPLSSFTCHPTHARQTTKYNSSGSFGGASLARGGSVADTEDLETELQADCTSRAVETRKRSTTQKAAK